MCSKLKLFLEFPTIPIIYLINKINITKYGHLLEKIRIIFQNFPKNVINDLYKLCFQNYCASSIKKEQLKLHQSLLGGKRGGGGGQKQP